MAKKKETKPKSKKRKAIEWSITGFFLALLAVVGGIRIYQFVTKDYALFGTQYPVVLTDSMEPDYPVGAVLIVEKVNPSAIKVGDDVSFNWSIYLSGKKTSVMMTHRVSDIKYFEEVQYDTVGDKVDEHGNPIVVEYHYTFTTHGINTNSEQCRAGGETSGDCTNQTQVFHENDLIGRVNGKSDFLSVMNKVFSSVWTLILLILIPGLYIVVTSVLELFKAFDPEEEKAKTTPNNKDVKEVEAKPVSNVLEGLSKEEIEKLKKEMLDELLNKKEKEK